MGVVKTLTMGWKSVHIETFSKSETILVFENLFSPFSCHLILRRMVDVVVNPWHSKKCCVEVKRRKHLVCLSAMRSNDNDERLTEKLILTMTTQFVRNYPSFCTDGGKANGPSVGSIERR